MNKNYIENPQLIEEKSFEIIEQEMLEINPKLRFVNRFEKHIFKRVIHTTADFSYLDTLKITNSFVDVISRALKNGVSIYTDTNMALSGINKRNLKDYNVTYQCLIADADTAKYAKEKGITRSMAAVDIAMKSSGDKIFVIGSAPTALYRILEHYDKGQSGIKCIVGVPVGFVGASESKVELHAYDIPHVTSISRKGGSNVAASIINAVTYEMIK